MKLLVYLSFLMFLLFPVTSFTTDKPQIPQENRFGRETKNGYGLNFNNLGEFEAQLIKDCNDLSLENSRSIPRILFLAAAFGRLPLTVIDKIEGDVEIFVNELSSDNLDEFIKKIAEISNNDDQKGRNARRVLTFAGDCLQLQQDPKFLRRAQQEGGNLSFDIIVADNLLHFFDGQQILDLLLQSYNRQKPKGKLYLFFQGPAWAIGKQDVGGKRNPFNYIINAMQVISCLASSSDKAILFPGLMRDEWLKNKSDALRNLFATKRNKTTQDHFIPAGSIEKLARAIGYSVATSDTFCMFSDGSFARNDERTDYIGMVLMKEKDDVRNIDDLDATIVSSCSNSLALMEEFVNSKANLAFIEFPALVEKGSRFCHAPDCFNVGTSACAQCKQTKYCSKACQTLDWKSGHKEACAKPKKY